MEFNRTAEKSIKYRIKSAANTVYMPLLGLRLSGKFLGIFQRSFAPLMACALTRKGSYTSR